MSDRATLAGKRVLLVEDEYFIAQDLRRSLTEANADIVGPVPTVADALYRFERADRVDAAVLDINLRGEAVYPLVDRLLEARVPMVFVTGYDSSEIPARYRRIARCEKPVTTERLVAALARDAH